MPNEAAVAALDQAFRTGLAHPGRPEENLPPKIISLPVFRSTGIPTEMADQFAAEAGFADNDTPRLTAEAAINTLEEAGLAIINAAELTELRTQAADAPDGKRTITAYCQCDVQRLRPLMRLTIDKTDTITIPGAILQPCTHGA